MTMQKLAIQRRHIPEDIARYTVMQQELATPRTLPRGVNPYSRLIPEVPYTVTVTDTSSRASIPERYTHAMIADRSFLQEFVETNNMLVGVAQDFGVNPGLLYDSFYTFGMRLSQQISERLKQRTEAEYERAVDALQDGLLDAIHERRELARTGDLDRLVSDEGLAHVPDPDRERITIMVTQLRDIPLSEPSAINFDGKLSHFRHERYLPIAGACIEVLPELRADFLATIKYGPLHGISPDPLDRMHDDINGFVQRLPVESARQYLGALRSEYARDHGDVHEYFMLLERQAKSWEGDQLVLLCETLQKAQREELPYVGDALAVSAVHLLERHDLNGARAIVDRALEHFRRTRDEAGALGIIDEVQK